MNSLISPVGASRRGLRFLSVAAIVAVSSGCVRGSLATDAGLLVVVFEWGAGIEVSKGAAFGCWRVPFWGSFWED